MQKPKNFCAGGGLQLAPLMLSNCNKHFFFLNSNPGIYKDIAEDVETRFDTSNFELDQPLPKGKNKKRYCTNER